MRFEDVKRIVEEKYNIEVEEVEKVKNVFKIFSYGNIYCLKVIKYNLKHFYFIINAMKHLENNNFKGSIPFIKNLQGEIYINFYDKFAYLTPWVDARCANYDNLVDVILATETLADLHLCSRGFRLTEDMQPRVGWFKWINTYNTRRNEILDFKSRIEKKDKLSEFDRVYLNIMEEELDRATRSIENLLSSNYIEVMEKQVNLRGFCHHDYAHHNVLINSNKNVNIIDFDYCILDTHLHDVSSLIIRKLKNGKWNVKDANFILSLYSKINEIHQNEIPIMAAFMEFPQEYWQVGIQYYWEKQPYGEEAFMNKLNRIIDDRADRQEFVDDFRYLRFGGD
ncbi:MAG: CotS family spore coat protein [Clostridiaceae bacterium]